MNRLFLAILIILGIIGLIYIYQSVIRVGQNQPSAPKVIKDTKKVEKVTVVTQDLEIPWATAFLPGGDILVTERPGRIQRVKKNGDKELVSRIDEVLHTGEGGLLGITLHPDFETNNYLYIYYTYSSSGNQTLNRVVRYKYQDNTLLDRQVVVDEIPGAVNHNGGRIKFGPDGYLYITTGDAQNPSLAQNTNSLAGKILRVTDDGKVPPDNPFDNPVYSYGHRNPQGLVWINGELWSVEHGQSAQDEINRIEKGQNYGWPIIRGEEQIEEMKTPVLQSGQDTWAPSGLTYYNGLLYFAGLRGNALYSFDPNNPESGVKEYFKDKYGRLREVVVGPDNYLYITTSNQDGRGIIRQGDDKILRIDPKLL